MTRLRQIASVSVAGLSGYALFLSMQVLAGIGIRGPFALNKESFTAAGVGLLACGLSCCLIPYLKRPYDYVSVTGVVVSIGACSLVPLSVLSLLCGLYAVSITTVGLWRWGRRFMPNASGVTQEGEEYTTKIKQNDLLIFSHETT